MAKGTSGRGNATGTPSSLTSLLALTQPAMPVALADPVIYNQLHHGNYGNEPIGDRRRHNPTKAYAPPHAPYRNATRLVINPVGTIANRALVDVPRFSVPNAVTICLRRKARREVLHAFNRTGKGSRGKRRRNFWSNVKC